MLRTVSRGVAVLALAMAVGGSAAGCSAADNAEACTNIANDIKNVSSEAMNHVSDPDGMAQTYHDGADKIRADAKDAGGDVKSAANKAADEMDKLGDQVAQRTTKMPDTSALTDAGRRLNDACG